MLLSVLLVISSPFTKVKKLIKTLESISDQIDKKNIELVISYNLSEQTNEIIDVVQKFLSEKKVIYKFVFNSVELSLPAVLNTGINLLKGDYFMMIYPGDILDNSFFDKIFDSAEKFNFPDIIEFNAEYFGDIKYKSTIKLKQNEIYDLPQDKEVFALLSSSNYNKIYRLKVLRTLKIKFIRFGWYNILFLYKFLSGAHTFVSISSSKPLMKVYITLDSPYSFLEIFNQWLHIFNYFKFINQFSYYKNDLYHAYIKYLLNTFIEYIKATNNEKLRDLAVKIITDRVRKLNKRFDIKSDIYFSEEELQEYSDALKNIDTFLTTKLEKRSPTIKKRLWQKKS